LAFLVTLEVLALSGLLDRLARRVPPDRRGRKEIPEQWDRPEPPERPATSDPPGRSDHQGLPENVVPLVMTDHVDPAELPDLRDHLGHPVLSGRRARRVTRERWDQQVRLDP